MSPSDHLALLLAARRDALLLAALALAIGVICWNAGIGFSIGGGAIAALLYTAAVALVRQAFDSRRTLNGTLYSGANSVWGVTLLLPALVTLLLWTRVAYLRLDNSLLVGGVAVLTAAWQLWLYAWSRR